MFKSYGFWTALAGAIALLAGALGKAFNISVDVDLVSEIIMAIAGVLVVMGVVSMPSKKDKKEDNIDKNASKDDKNEENSSIFEENDEINNKKDDKDEF